MIMIHNNYDDNHDNNYNDNHNYNDNDNDNNCLADWPSTYPDTGFPNWAAVPST